MPALVVIWLSPSAHLTLSPLLLRNWVPTLLVPEVSFVPPRPPVPTCIANLRLRRGRGRRKGNTREEATLVFSHLVTPLYIELLRPLPLPQRLLSEWPPSLERLTLGLQVSKPEGEADRQEEGEADEEEEEAGEVGGEDFPIWALPRISTRRRSSVGRYPPPPPE